MSVEDKFRKLCSQLISVPDDSKEFIQAAAQLNASVHQQMESLKRGGKKQDRREEEWKKHGEADKHVDGARQPYQSRESDSADAFAEGQKLPTPKKRRSQEETE